jgi:hypothetical protein
MYFNGVLPDNCSTPGTPCYVAWNKLLALTTEAGVNWYDLYRRDYGPLSSTPVLESEKAPHDPNDHTVTRPLRGEERMAYTFVDGERKDYKVGYTMNEYTPWLKPILGDSGENSLSNYLSHYMNSQEVRTALHIPSTLGGWTGCNDYINNNYKLNPAGSLEIYNRLKNKMKILFYCGDTDGAVPCYGAQQWIKKLNRETLEQT